MATRTILIADDEPHLTQIVAYNIRKSGAIVHVAANGAECVQLASSVIPDLIISDYQMPVMDGLAACIKLKENHSTARIPVLMLTARGHRLADSDLALTNIVAVLPKPFSARELLAKISALLPDDLKEVAA